MYVQCAADKFETRAWSFYTVATMPLALQYSVEIELLIDDSRDELFKRIIFQDPHIPPGHVPHKLASTSQASLDGCASPDRVDGEPLTFCIQDSYLSSDGSERIFKVQCGTFGHFYYAFEFNDYVVCPAFLVSMFNINRLCIS